MFSSNRNKLYALVWLLFVATAVTMFFIHKPLEQATPQQDPQPQAVIKQPEPKVDIPEIEASQQDIPDFAAFNDVRQKKIAFINYLKPVIERRNQLLVLDRQMLSTLAEKITLEVELLPAEQARLLELAGKYKESKTQDTKVLVSNLLIKVDEIPITLALMQAANESGWGTSRFARQGYNFFGLWCYQQGCGFVPAARNEGAQHEVARFNSIDHAVDRYMTNLNTHYAYEYLREIRFSLRNSEMPLDSELIATGLVRYSQRGSDYVIELINMMRTNRKYIEKT